MKDQGGRETEPGRTDEALQRSMKRASIIQQLWIMGQHAEAMVQIRGRRRRHAAFIPVGDPVGEVWRLKSSDSEEFTCPNCWLSLITFTHEWVTRWSRCSPVVEQCSLLCCFPLDMNAAMQQPVNYFILYIRWWYSIFFLFSTNPMKSPKLTPHPHTISSCLFEMNWKYWLPGRKFIRVQLMNFKYWLLCQYFLKKASFVLSTV